MNNPLKQMILDTSNLPIYRLADKVGITRNTAYRLVREGKIPGGTKLETLDKIARVLGYRVRVSFEPIDNTGQADNL